MKKEENQIKQFFGAYFHQDWDIDGDNWEQVIATYLETNDVNEIRNLTVQIDNLIQDIRSNKVDENTFPSNYDCEYNFVADGLSALEWLSRMNAALKDGISS
ncbi:hypothetical protein SAMN04488056_1353 [Cohaesibacter marisflavi]|uniref:CdiI immunity protein domain-containing protein n=1 Tax=Cohaesibacter marisflavi TaxID=655353 RepID=A0A1I5NKY5_9HYPH|nr:contact-dependent growth inhibition system immunity protein [Cohaesibacter marisflavi]SFP22473.1 hypothetical protein SAMN04488056_1353 [Cohaesibacter marisflavi]